MDLVGPVTRVKKKKKILSSVECGELAAWALHADWALLRKRERGRARERERGGGREPPALCQLIPENPPRQLQAWLLRNSLLVQVLQLSNRPSDSSAQYHPLFCLAPHTQHSTAASQPISQSVSQPASKTDRQIDRYTDRQTDRQAEERKKERKTDRKTNRQTAKG